MKNQLLLYSTSKTIDVYKEKISENMRQIHLYKFLYLLDLKLEEIGIDIRLPYYWYKFGPLLDVSSFYSETKTQFIEFSPPGTSKVSKPIGMSLPKTQKEYRDSIDEAIILLADDLKNKIDLISSKIHDPVTEVLISEAYKTAPYKFQPLFREFRGSLSDDYYGSPSILYRDISKAFPEDDFIDIFDMYLEWEAVVDIALDTDDRKFIDRISTLLWDSFCYMIAPMKFKNVIQSTISTRQEDIKLEIPKKEYDIRMLSSSYYMELGKSKMTSQNIRDLNSYYKVLREDIGK